MGKVSTQRPNYLGQFIRLNNETNLDKSKP